MEKHVSGQQQAEIVFLDVAMSENTQESSLTIELSVDEVEFAFGNIIWGS